MPVPGRGRARAAMLPSVHLQQWSAGAAARQTQTDCTFPHACPQPNPQAAHIMQQLQGAPGGGGIAGDQRQAAHALAIQSHVLAEGLQAGAEKGGAGVWSFPMLTWWARAQGRPCHPTAARGEQRWGSGPPQLHAMCARNANHPPGRWGILHRGEGVTMKRKQPRGRARKPLACATSISRSVAAKMRRPSASASRSTTKPCGGAGVA